jgi:hypothetical protein
MYTLKSIFKQGTVLGVVAAMVVATVVPSASVLADALNPLTERSLLLSSSAPGYQNSDGSNNPETVYSPPGSGPNGQKTGETFSFNISTPGVAIHELSFQYCVEAAGLCKAPGNNAGDADLVESDGTTPRASDRKTNAEAMTDGDNTADLDFVYDTPVAGTHFSVFLNEVDVSTYVDGEDTLPNFTMAMSNDEDSAHSEALTGKNNFVTLTSVAGITPTNVGDNIRVVFHASATHYITNPGSGSFFVKINTYDTDNEYIDGGVTVANVMTDSIHIHTKVLETMAFSVGVHNRDTEVLGGGETHGTCDAIEGGLNGNMIPLGNQNAENSLETGKAHDTFSYWRLSSNSSGGATVYYSGETLANTVGDVITPFPTTGANSNPGTEQFGIGFVDASQVSTSFTTQMGELGSDLVLPNLGPLNKAAAYDMNADGRINPDATDPEDILPINAGFAFDRNSLTTPVMIANNTAGVLNCATAKMRYVANISPATPAGVYTTKINYLAAPQY